MTGEILDDFIDEKAKKEVILKVIAVLYILLITLNVFSFFYKESFKMRSHINYAYIIGTLIGLLLPMPGILLLVFKKRAGWIITILFTVFSLLARGIALVIMIDSFAVQFHFYPVLTMLAIFNFVLVLTIFCLLNLNSTVFLLKVNRKMQVITIVSYTCIFIACYFLLFR